MSNGIMKTINWIFFRIVFAVAVYYGFFVGIQGAENVAFGIAWFGVVLSLFLFSDKIRDELKEKPRTGPRWLSVPFDVSMILIFIWFGHFITASFYMYRVFIVEAFWVATAREAAESEAKAAASEIAASR